MKKYIVRLNGKEYEVEMEEVTRAENDAVLATTDVTSTENHRAKPTGVGEGTLVKAPMPGSINDVSVKTGDQVRKGDVLLILEAMKMMNEIVSPSDGVITGVSATKGDSVSTGDPLISLN